ncbi:MAG: PEGA domain-containing protein [Deltaproteobacteria bacterium]|nr:PEGA domain-containing protein [Deltaproteobacteria bacterium]
MQGLPSVDGLVRIVLVIGLLAASAESAAQEPAPGVVVITAGDEATSGAAIRLDGKSVGNVPLRETLAPGRHLVQVGKRGFVTFSKWVDLESGQVLTIPVTLQPREAKTGSLLVTADVTGMPVFIDGQRRGATPLVVDGLTAGEHLVEIRSPGDGYKPFTKVVTIAADKRVTLDASIRIAPDLGSLRVITNVPGAIISLDGTDIGISPAAKGGLSPGEHVVMASATGYEPVEQTVTVVAGRERVVSVRFTTASTDVARILIRANIPDASISIDGEDYGAPPVTIEPAELGTHSVVVRAPGYREVRRTCSVSPTRNCEIYAELFPLGVPVRVEANVPDAQLFVDGELRGPMPWEGDLAAGSHRIEVRAEGYHPHTEQVRLEKSARVRLIQVILAVASVPVNEEARDKEAERRDELRNTVTHAGAPVPVGVAALDFSAGWPWLASLGLRTGLTRFLDVGIWLGTFGRLTDVAVSTKAGWRVSDNFSLGGDLQIGGGAGPAQREPNGNKHPTNNFFINLDAIFSLHFPPRGALSIWMAMDFNSDRWDFADRNSNEFVTSSRQNIVRGRLGGSLEIVVTRKWNVWIEVEGIVAGDRRRVLGDVFGGGRPDSKIYARAGATFKFGSVKEDSR